MIEIVFLIVLAGIWIAAASYQDLKTTEVPNWLSFSLIGFALGFRFFYCLFSSSANGFSFFYQGLIGLGIFFVLGNLFYYGKIFAGGDAKLMIALGSVLPLSESFFVNLRIYVLFLFLFLFFGAIYGLGWSFFYMTKNFKNFKKEFLKQIRLNKKLVLLFVFFGIFLLIFGIFSELFLIFGIFVILSPYFMLYAKSVENSSMIVKISTQKLREGDWLYKDVSIGNKTIKSKWEGVSQFEIKKLQKIKYVWIKKGIPFVPVFLFAFIAIVYFWSKSMLYFF
jgi:Flp pilus assembly protein protease CpaA